MPRCTFAVGKKLDGRQCLRNVASSTPCCWQHTTKTMDCTICIDTIEKRQEPITLKCGHTFHSACMLSWIQKQDSCPNCRATVSFSNVADLYLHRAAGINEMISFLPAANRTAVWNLLQEHVEELLMDTSEEEIDFIPVPRD